MKVLYVTGASLTRNTSANMSHNGFVKGFLDYGCDVDIIMANSSWGEEDKVLLKWDNAKYFEFNSVSFGDKLRKKFRQAESYQEISSSLAASATDMSLPEKMTVKQCVRKMLKSVFYMLFPNDPVYPLEHHWLKTAISFRSNEEYDIVVSNSSPAASHKLVSELLKKSHIRCKRWIQIWEDPWYHDLYGGHSDAVLKEEQYLLHEAQEIYYVSPLTLMYQKKYFPDCAYKMKCVPLPYFTFSDKGNTETIEENSFGYFGDYYSQTRNLKPFYEALCMSGYRGFIYGDSNEHFQNTDKIEVSGRVTLDKLAGVQNKTAVLVHLCNLSGGQIPGKIYHYSATDKPILFILDGTSNEIAAIRKFFEKYNRYYFCENNAESITEMMNLICHDKKAFKPVTQFEPRSVVANIMEATGNV